MNETNRRSSQCVTPHTERNAPGRNWELFKNIVSNSSLVEVDTTGKENVKKKTVPHHQKSKTKHIHISTQDAKPQLIKEKDVVSNSSLVEVDTTGKHNVKKKTVSHHKRSEKKHIHSLILDTKPQLIKEKDVVSNSSPVEVDTTGKNNVKKKFSHQKRSEKKHTHGLTLDAKPQLIKEKDYDNKKKLTKHIAMDCEMVGIGDGTESMIARVSIVNSHGYPIYDKYVKPREPVQDYRTKVSGIRPHDLENGEDFQVVQKEVADILKGRILVGHALKHDLDVLYLSHPRRHLRDTSKFKTFRQLSRGNIPSLKKLTHELLGREIQIGEHSSVEDAKAAMQLYVLYKNKWESEFYSKR